MTDCYFCQIRLLYKVIDKENKNKNKKLIKKKNVINFKSEQKEGRNSETFHLFTKNNYSYSTAHNLI